MREPTAWEFWIDRGGTFTDVVARTPGGELLTAKYLSEDPERYADAALFGVADLLSRHGATLTATKIGAVKLGTTVATNALLERRGDPTVLAITAGFGDALRIGYQNRPDIFALDIELPAPLYAAKIDVAERVTASGDVLTPLDEDDFKARLAHAREAGLRAIAIVLLHGFRYPAHERRCAELARSAGFAQVSVSHEVSSLVKLIARGDTTVADAYLTPSLKRYIDSVRSGLGATAARRLFFMQSSGGLTEAARFSGHNSVLSGPAAGVVGMARTAAAAGFDRVIGFDMGGTSTDVALFDRAYERDVDNVVAGVRMQTPMMKIHTLAAGGGSCLTFRDGRMQVGPQSAGALPGPACYRRGGPLAVTDINAFQGKLRPEFFPQVFGDSGEECLEVDASRAAFEALATDIGARTGTATSAEAVAEGFLTIAIDKMALAIRQTCLSRGIDVDRFCMASFGGAAGQHACRVADAVGIRTILIHPKAGVLSALGMGLADLTALRVTSLRQTLDTAILDELAARYAELRATAHDELVAAGLHPDEIDVTATCRLRYAGSDTSLEVPRGEVAAMRADFVREHHKRFGFSDEHAAIVVESLMVEARGGGREAPPWRPVARGEPAPRASHAVYLAGRWRETPFFDRDALPAGHVVNGPAVIIEATSTTVVEPLWRARVCADGQLALTRATAARRRAGDTRCDPVRLELFNNLYMHIAEQMGLVLQKTARSVNIKERLDFSCALFDRAGDLIANAPHMPVHLGSMGESVRAVIRGAGRLRRDESFVLNDPYAGGTHLPDITVVTPFFGDEVGDAAEALFFVASRGHHADIGGITPGSMPAASHHIDEEGVLIGVTPLVRGGRFQDAEMRRLLSEARYPARNPEQNIADLKAQLAANAFGIQQLGNMLDEHGAATALAYTAHVKDNAAAAVREALAQLSDGEFSCELDNGARIGVRVVVRDGEAVVDFAATSAQTNDNFNAPAAVCRAAVLYVFRTLVARNIPMNAGCLRPIDIRIPTASLLRPESPCAVAAGNVETSMCVTDALYGALGVLASSQGTMNNLTFGNERVQYYETLCGGGGAGQGFAGSSAVHTHMTNSRLTDPEVIEARYPVLVRRFAIRHGSGGVGRWSGGDGIVREFEFRDALDVSLLTNRRRVAPFGLRGGGAGKRGVNRLYRKNGVSEILPATASFAVGPGDRLEIRTPGGGGFGRPD